RHAAAGQNQVEGVALADEARQPNGAKVNEGHTPAAAEDAEDGVARGDTQIAPASQLEAPGDRVALHGGHHGFIKHEPRWPHGTVTILCYAVALRRSHRIQVGARAKRSSGPGEDGHCE